MQYDKCHHSSILYNDILAASKATNIMYKAIFKLFIYLFFFLIFFLESGILIIATATAAAHLQNEREKIQSLVNIIQ